MFLSSFTINENAGLGVDREPTHSKLLVAALQSTVSKHDICTQALDPAPARTLYLSLATERHTHA